MSCDQLTDSKFQMLIIGQGMWGSFQCASCKIRGYDAYPEIPPTWGKSGVAPGRMITVARQDVSQWTNMKRHITSTINSGSEKRISMLIASVTNATGTSMKGKTNGICGAAIPGSVTTEAALNARVLSTDDCIHNLSTHWDVIYISTSCDNDSCDIAVSSSPKKKEGMLRKDGG